MQKLSVSKRPGQIGGSIVNRTQMHGKKEKVPAVSIPVGGIILTPEEFGIIMQDPEAYEHFFTSTESKVMQPRYPHIDPIIPAGKFENAKVTIRPDDSDESLILKPAIVGGVEITRQGAQPIMKCMVSGVPDVHLQTLTFLNKRCTIAILNGALADRDDKQKDLPLAGGGPNIEANGEDADDEAPTMLDKEGSPTLHDAIQEEERATESAIGRQIRVSEVKKRKAAKKRGEAR